MGGKCQGKLLPSRRIGDGQRDERRSARSPRYNAKPQVRAGFVGSPRARFCVRRQHNVCRHRLETDAEEVFGRRTAKPGEEWRKVERADLFAHNPEVTAAGRGSHLTEETEFGERVVGLLWGGRSS